MTDTETFTLTRDHIALLRSAYVSWDDMEFGAPCIDPKRPYGNSNVYTDIAEILEWDVPQDVLDGEEDFPEELEDRAETLHEETQTALQVILDTGDFRAGKYERERYGGRWHLAPDPAGEARAALHWGQA